MRSAFSALMPYVVSHFRSHESQRLENMALRHQLAIYQQTVKRPKLSPADRLFWIWLSRLWPGWKDALEFVQPRTVLAWQKKRFRDFWRRLSQSGTPGHPPISKEVRDLIRDMWRSNPTWGSPRIEGELRKLGITVAKSTVEKYRPRIRKPSSPTWRAFLANHVKDIVACDFFTVPGFWGGWNYPQSSGTRPDSAASALRAECAAADGVCPLGVDYICRQVQRQLRRNELARFYHHRTRKCMPKRKLRL